MKQVRPAGQTMPPSTTVVSVGEGGQPAGEVDPIAIVVEVALNAPSSVLTKRKQDDGVGSFGRKMLKAHMSLHALRQAVGLTLGVGRPLIVQNVPSTPPVVKALTAHATSPAPSLLLLLLFRRPLLLLLKLVCQLLWLVLLWHHCPPLLHLF